MFDGTMSVILLSLLGAVSVGGLAFVILDPLMSDEPVPKGLRPLARRAVKDCPVLALMLVPDR